MGITLAVVSIVIEGWATIFSSAFFSSFGKSIETILYLIFPGLIAFAMVMSEY